MFRIFIVIVFGVIGAFIGGLVYVIALAAAGHFKKKKPAQNFLTIFKRLPISIPHAHFDAIVACKKCLEMCQAASVVECLKLAEDGDDEQTARYPSEEELIQHRKKISATSLRNCTILANRSLTETVDARFLILTGFFQAAVNKCLRCRPLAGNTACPAMEILQRMNLA